VGLFSGPLRKDAVWQKGRAMIAHDPNVWRMDSMGGVMRYADYGNRDSAFGWEIDHIDPNGPDELWNLQPLYWRNNARKSDQPLDALSFAMFLCRKK
jgi:hypothetical protein